MEINARVLGWTDKCCGCGKDIPKTEKVYMISDLLGISGSIHLCEDCISKITYNQGIALKNIDLTGILPVEQARKTDEEIREFCEAFNIYKSDKTEENKKDVIAEYFDMLQASLGLLEKEGIPAEEVMKAYPKHLEKLQKRGNKPREKKCSKCINCSIEKTNSKEKILLCSENKGRTHEEFAKECKYYKEQEE